MRERSCAAGASLLSFLLVCRSGFVYLLCSCCIRRAAEARFVTAAPLLKGTVQFFVDLQRRRSCR